MLRPPQCPPTKARHCALARSSNALSQAHVSAWLRAISACASSSALRPVSRAGGADTLSRSSSGVMLLIVKGVVAGLILMSVQDERNYGMLCVV